MQKKNYFVILSSARHLKSWIM